MRIVLLGAPGSGKGTQAALLVDTLNLPHVSTGDLLRSAVAQGTDLGLQAKAVMERGELVSDDIMLGLIEERLGRDDAAAGFILDGYPRNIAQAESLTRLLDRMDKPVDLAIQIDVDDESVVSRIAQRATEEGRSDDTAEVVRNRLRVYAEQTAPVIEFYLGLGILSRVLGEGTINEVSQRIIGVVRTEQSS